MTIRDHFFLLKIQLKIYWVIFKKKFFKKKGEYK